MRLARIVNSRIVGLGIIVAAVLFAVSGWCQEESVPEQQQGEQVIIQPLAYGEEDELLEDQDQMQVIPTFSISGGTEENLFRTEDNERQVFRYLLQPGIRFVYDRGKSSVNIAYALNAHFFEDLDDVPEGEKDADEDNYVGHSFFFSAKTSPTAKLSVGLEDAFILTEEPSKAERFANDIERDRYRINRLTPMLFYQFNRRFSIDLRYRNVITDYDDSDEDSVEHGGIAGLSYHFSPTASMTLGYQYWDRNYDVDVSDFTAEQIGLTFRKQAKYNIYEAGIGYQMRDFDEDFRDEEEALTYNLSFTRELSEATYARLAFEQNFNESGIPDNFFEATQFSMSLGKVFRDRVPVTLQGFYRMADYPQFREFAPGEDFEEREDDRYGISASVGYKFTRWLTLTLAGGYENNDSNIEDFDYENSFINLIIGLNIGYSFIGEI